MQSQVNITVKDGKATIVRPQPDQVQVLDLPSLERDLVMLKQRKVDTLKRQADEQVRTDARNKDDITKQDGEIAIKEAAILAIQNAQK